VATSETQIANMALAHLANGGQIAALTEKSKEARACTLFYEQCRDEVLGAFPWPFATRIEALALVATDPTDEYGYSYRYPVNALSVWRIPSGVDRVGVRSCSPLDWRGAFPRVPIPYRIISDAAGKLIYTDQPDASIEYTVRITNVTQFSADFTAALALKLAGDIAPMVTGGDQFKLGERAIIRYQTAVAQAQARAANEERQDPPPDSEFITVRN